MQRTENGPVVRSGWAWPGLTRHGYGVNMHLALVVLVVGCCDAMPIHNEESSGLAAAGVDISLPLAASAAIAGAGALVAGSVTRGVAGQPAANVF